jgi:putative transposase
MDKAVLLRLVEAKQYTSWAFGRRLRGAGLLGSMGTIGDCFGTMQIELLDEHRWETRKQLALAMFDWIEAWYNPSRRHSYCGMLSPVDYERVHTPTAAAA